MYVSNYVYTHTQTHTHSYIYAIVHKYNIMLTYHLLATLQQELLISHEWLLYACACINMPVGCLLS